MMIGVDINWRLSILQWLGFQRAGGGGRDKIGPGSAAGRHVRQRHPYRVLPKVGGGGGGVCTLYGGRNKFVLPKKVTRNIRWSVANHDILVPEQQHEISFFSSPSTMFTFFVLLRVAFFVGSLSFVFFHFFQFFLFLLFLCIFFIFLFSFTSFSFFYFFHFFA